LRDRIPIAVVREWIRIARGPAAAALGGNMRAFLIADEKDYYTGS